MEIHRDLEQKRLWLSQDKYVSHILDWFNMVDSKRVWTPLATHFKLSAAQCPTDAVEKGKMPCVPYEQAVDSLMYLMMCTRPDIAFAMDKVMGCRVKHIDNKYHFFKQVVSEKMIELVKIDDKLNLADALTKIIPLKSLSQHYATM
ncbi:hypothetical protein AXG93_1104s1170 [Marchantia polymorpha subsp. ruderalis]|uniref:Reverse transcriptase Ty1/copia-type domain-containing protein n=1 Tax=Marchantia polymorpha subsp. ruderalis TaxID=1480154 RepID=A0A176WMQ5_MARPO|nr:hypothetical protein AXG93_1104s1170 [Marchantia polymorpha subsp. ruderalis]